MISIVIPAFKEEKAIGETIDQFKNLSLPHEVIVGDGRSPDKTEEIARSRGAKVAVFTGARHTPSHGRNDGAKLASGDMFLFIDSATRIPEIDAFIKKALAHFDDPRVVGLAAPQRIYPEIETLLDKAILIVTNFLLRLQKVGSGKFIMIRREAFERIGGFREDLVAGEDHDVFRRLKKIGIVHFDPSLTVFYSGRREHTIGWSKVIWTWTVDGVWLTFFNRSRSTEWTAVR